MLLNEQALDFTVLVNIFPFIFTFSILKVRLKFAYFVKIENFFAEIAWSIQQIFFLIPRLASPHRDEKEARSKQPHLSRKDSRKDLQVTFCGI